MWTAAIMTDTTARDLFISSVFKYASNEFNSAPLSDWYDTISGDDQGFRARPVVGGHLGTCLCSLCVNNVQLIMHFLFDLNMQPW